MSRSASKDLPYLCYCSWATKIPQFIYFVGKILKTNKCKLIFFFSTQCFIHLTRLKGVKKIPIKKATTSTIIICGIHFLKQTNKYIWRFQFSVSTVQLHGGPNWIFSVFCLFLAPSVGSFLSLSSALSKMAYFCPLLPWVIWQNFRFCSLKIKNLKDYQFLISLKSSIFAPFYSMLSHY